MKKVAIVNLVAVVCIALTGCILEMLFCMLLFQLHCRIEQHEGGTRDLDG